MNDGTPRTGAARGRRVAGMALPLCGVLLLAGCGGPFPQSAMIPAGDMAESLQGLFELIVWLALGVFVLVEGALLVAIFRFRSRRAEASGAEGQELAGEPRFMHGNTMLELAWTLAPALVLIGIAVPTMTTIWEVDRPTADTDALRVDVMAHQWWWEFRYPEYDLVTANEVRVPVGRTVDFRLNSADVIHSFWFPRQGGKRDVIPGKENHLWFRADSLGRYPGQCAEFCGLSHALMKMEIVVESEEDFDAWVEAQTRPSPALQDAEAAEVVERGQELMMSRGCIACHTIDGTQAAGVLGPDLSHVGSRHTIAAGILENDPENMIRWIRDPAAVKPGAKMPTLQLTDEELQALADYLGSLE